MADCLNSRHDNTLRMEIDKEALFWLPIMAGVATKEEVQIATIEELRKLCIIAEKKLEWMGGGIRG